VVEAGFRQAAVAGSAGSVAGGLVHGAFDAGAAGVVGLERDRGLRGRRPGPGPGRGVARSGRGVSRWCTRLSRGMGQGVSGTPPAPCDRTPDHPPPAPASTSSRSWSAPPRPPARRSASPPAATRSPTPAPTATSPACPGPRTRPRSPHRPATGPTDPGSPPPVTARSSGNRTPP
jgi:hypothetical protein